MKEQSEKEKKRKGKEKKTILIIGHILHPQFR